MDALTPVYLLLYGAAAVLYLAFATGGKSALSRVARLLLLAGFAVQLVDIGLRCLHGANPVSSTAEALAFIAWLVVGGYLAAAFRYRLDAAGAFAVPSALVPLLLARVLPAANLSAAMGGGGGGAPVGTEGSLGTIHIFLATVGVAAFALASVLAAVYLLQERRLKRKQLRLGKSTTPLDTLDRLGGHCVSFGFPVFTLAILTGALWIARLGLLRTAATVRPEYVLAVASWLAFGVLLVARVGAGWQGRRAAWLTLGGFSGAAIVVVAYFLRHAT